MSIILFSLTQAWLCSRTLNGVLASYGLDHCFSYLVSGGDEALIISKELPEDDPGLGEGKRETERERERERD